MNRLGELPEFDYEGEDISDTYRKRENFFNPLKFDTTGYATIPVLEFLNGKKLNNLVMCYVYALKPTAIRVTNGWMTSDGHLGRVTIMLEEDNKTIKYIDQEMNIGGGSGSELRNAFRKQYPND